MSEKQRALEALAAAQWKLALRLTAAMMAVYFGFILLGALVIVTAWILIWIYVRWANSHYDATVARIRETGR